MFQHIFSRASFLLPALAVVSALPIAQAQGRRPGPAFPQPPLAPFPPPAINPEDGYGPLPGEFPEPGYGPQPGNIPFPPDGPFQPNRGGHGGWEHNDGRGGWGYNRGGWGRPVPYGAPVIFYSGSRCEPYTTAMTVVFDADWNSNNQKCATTDPHVRIFSANYQGVCYSVFSLGARKTGWDHVCPAAAAFAAARTPR